MGKGKGRRAEEEERKEREKDKMKIQNKVAKLGMVYEDVDIPPDEVDRKDVSKSMLHTFKAMIPYTNEYYEALQAEEEMDDLFKIQVEKTRARELVSKSRVGRHDEALEEMMDETDHDFHYFNKIKHRQELEGKFKYVPRSTNPFKYMEGQNRLRKAVAMQFGLLDDELLKKLSAHGRDLASQGVKLQDDKHLPCSWRGKGENDVDLHCSGPRAAHTTKTVKNNRNEDVPMYTAHCAYHALSCLGFHEEEYPPKIFTPNSEGLCTECYVHKMKTLPPRLTPDSVPTVFDPKDPQGQVGADDEDRGSVDEVSSSVADQRYLALQEERDAESGGLTEDSLCCWVPSAEESLTQMRGYICRNKVFRHPVTMKLLRTCALHVKFCVKPHEDGGAVGGLIETPNIHALCNMHHVAEHGIAPLKLNFPYPGMEHRLKNKGWMVKPGHWAAPSWPPLRDVVSKKQYRVPEKPIGYMNKMREAARLMIFRKRKKQFGKYAAVAIQAVYRGYRLRHTHKPRLYELRIPLRIEKAVLIQCQMRRFLGNKIVVKRRKEYNSNALFIQRVFRGYVARKWIKRNEAAKVLQRASKVFKDRQFFNTVMMLVQLRKLFQRRDEAILLMQRTVRGYMARLRLRRHRSRVLLKFHQAAFILQITFKKIARWKAEIRRRERMNSRVALQRKLAHMIEELFFIRQDKRRLWSLIQKSAPVIQSLVRGFVGRHRSHRMKYLRKALRSWCHPVYAVEFMRQHLENRVPHMGAGRTSILMPEVLANFVTAKGKRQKRKELTFLVEHLPPESAKLVDVDKKTLVVALTGWYKATGKPLLSSEVESIYQRFRNPVDAKVNILEIDNYIKKHRTGPCHKHARAVCGDCVFHRECNFPKCTCRCFKRDSITGTICRECHHSIIIHTLFPLHMKPSRQMAGKTMLKILNAVSEPDMSIPENVKGLELQDIGRQIYREKNKNKREAKRLEEEKSGFSTENSIGSPTKGAGRTHSSLYDGHTDRAAPSQLVQSLAYLDKDGSEVANEKEYWDQRSPRLPINKGVYFNRISACSVPPNVDITAAEFWSSAPKNPNKTTRDYHEKFEHNMPLPIVAEDRLTYTLEGPMVYIQMLHKIIQLEEADPKNIHFDGGDLLRLIVNHIQVFERHWRKMVVDLRTGELNRHLIVDPKARALYLSTAMPRPALASRLDKTFRDLGFHMKVLGKDIVMKGFAERKKMKGQEYRRPSFPENTFGSTGFHSSDLDTSGTSHGHGSQDRVKFSATEMHSPPGTHSANKSSKSRRPTIKHADTAVVCSRTSPEALSLGGSLDATQLTVTQTSFNKKKLKKMNKAEALVMASTMGSAGAQEIRERTAEKMNRGATANRRNFVRRNSDTDSFRPCTVDQLQKITHTLLTDPQVDYHNLVALSGRFICPFPACGLSFTSRDAAFDHLRTHEQKRKLYAPSALADSHLNYYWPKDNLWRDNPKYTKRVIPPGAIKCTFKGCQEVFISRHRLEYHMKWVHNTESRSMTLQSFFKFIGKSTATPPYPPPDYAPADFCSKHLKLDKKCPMCVSITEDDGKPKQPMYFYDSVRVDFTKRDGKGGDVLLERSNSDKGVFYVNNTAGQTHGKVCRGRPVGMLKDCKGDGWVALVEVISILEAQELHKKFPRDGDTHHELVRMNESDGSGTISDPGAPKWVRLIDVTGMFYLIETTKEDFSYRLRNGSIPRDNVFFIRPKPTTSISSVPSTASRQQSNDTSEPSFTPALRKSGEVGSRVMSSRSHSLQQQTPKKQRKSSVV
mmetsp:Transcript_16109/g.24282  ORF Transcript_16109/g.24282 Transcript_16109/m.24282 type:complete len:1767 (-) Transcript_16109:119-5419(-)